MSNTKSKTLCWNSSSTNDGYLKLYETINSPEINTEINTSICDELGLDAYLLKRNGWVLSNDLSLRRNDYIKTHTIKDMDGGNYQIVIKLIHHEDVVLVFINDQWIGRVTTIQQANAIANTIFTNIG